MREPMPLCPRCGSPRVTRVVDTGKSSPTMYMLALLLGFGTVQAIAALFGTTFFWALILFAVGGIVLVPLIIMVAGWLVSLFVKDELAFKCGECGRVWK